MTRQGFSYTPHSGIYGLPLVPACQQWHWWGDFGGVRYHTFPFQNGEKLPWGHLSNTGGSSAHISLQDRQLYSSHPIPSILLHGVQVGNHCWYHVGLLLAVTAVHEVKHWIHVMTKQSHSIVAAVAGGTAEVHISLHLKTNCDGIDCSSACMVLVVWRNPSFSMISMSSIRWECFDEIVERPFCARKYCGCL